MSKPPKPGREKSKTQQWEKERRNRINDYFSKLWQVLPIYDASKPLSKPDILIHAASTIKDLDEKLKNLLVSDNKEKPSEGQLKVSSDVIKKLQERVRKLLLRNEQLANLLSKAGIKVPSECGSVKKFKKSLKYSNAVSNEQQAKFLQKELEKENQVKGLTRRASKSSVKVKKVCSKPRNRRSKKQLFSSPNCLLVVSQPAVPNNSYFILSKSPAKLNQTVMTNSLLVKAPMVSSDIKPSIFPTWEKLSGTLLFADGTVMPIAPNPRSLPILPTIFTNPVPTPRPTVIVVSTKSNSVNSACAAVPTEAKMSLKCTLQTVANTLSKKSLSTNSLPVLRPKSNITRTTQVNKVPIPALSSKFNKHSCLGIKKSQASDQKKKDISTTSSTKKRIPEVIQNEPKKLKIISEKIVKKDVVAKNSTYSDEVETPSSARQSELTNQKSDRSSDNQSCDKVVKDSNSQPVTSGNTNICSEVQPAKEASSQASILDSFPSQSFMEDDNRKVIKLNETTNCISVSSTTTNHANPAVTVESQQAKISDKETFKPSDTLVTAAPISSQKNEISVNVNSESIETVNTSITRNVDSVSKQLKVNTLHFEKCTNNSLKGNIVDNPTVTKPSEVHNMQHKPFVGVSSCLKQNSKPFELTNSLHAHSTNVNDLKTLEINLPQTELSNDIFASFQVPPGCQNPESTSPTAAFLLAFPLVSSGAKVAEVMGDENSESQAGTPNLLQIGTMDISKPTQSYSENLTSNLLNFDNFSFFNSNKDNCGGGFYNCSMVTTNSVTSKTITSFATSNDVVQNLNALDNTVKNNQIKPPNNELKFPHFNKSEMINHKQINHNIKPNINSKNSTHVKYPNYLGNSNSHVVKDHQINVLAQSAEKPVAPSLMQVNNTNVLDLNSDIFSFKSTPNENYLNSNKQTNIGNVPAPMYATSKHSSNLSNYPNYKSCNSSVSNQFITNKHYPPVYTSASISNNFYNSFGTDGDNRNFAASNCNSYTDYNRKSFANNNNCNSNSQMYQKEKANNNMQAKVKPPSQNKPINWMTTPSTTTTTYKPDYFLPPFSKEPSFNSNLVPNTLPSNTYFNSSVYNANEHLNVSQDFRKASDMPLPTYSSYQRNETEENQFSWSPNKMPQFLDTTHAHSFVSSTLPTLVGDLALNNTPIIDQKNLKDRNRENRRKTCENQSSFLSVSQLVEPSQENVPAKVVSRRSSGNRSKTNTPKVKRTSVRPEANKETMQNYQKNEKPSFNISVATNLFNEGKQRTNNNSKHIPSSYSAEALIGNQGSSGESSTKRNNPFQNKNIVPSFFNDNMVSYFPPVEVTQDNSYMPSSQTYQSNSFSQNFPTTFQNNSYATNNFIPSSCTITSSYIPSNNFMPNTNTQDFLGENANLFQSSNNAVDNKDKCTFTKTYYKPPDKEDKSQSYSCKKAKKRSLNDNVLPSFDIHFFSMPGAINSPILPDDFHTTYLPPTTLYSCKNPLYSKPNTEAISSSLIPPLPAISGNKPAIQHPQMSPSVNSAGTSLTNFNLSTIFPEINKGPVQETFSDNRSKDYNPVSKSFPMSSSVQVPFSNKSSIIF